MLLKLKNIPIEPIFKSRYGLRYELSLEPGWRDTLDFLGIRTPQLLLESLNRKRVIRNVIS